MSYSLLMWPAQPRMWFLKTTLASILNWTPPRHKLPIRTNSRPYSQRMTQRCTFTRHLQQIRSCPTWTKIIKFPFLKPYQILDSQPRNKQWTSLKAVQDEIRKKERMSSISSTCSLWWNSSMTVLTSNVPSRLLNKSSLWKRTMKFTPYSNLW